MCINACVVCNRHDLSTSNKHTQTRHTHPIFFDVYISPILYLIGRFVTRETFVELLYKYKGNYDVKNHIFMWFFSKLPHMKHVKNIKPARNFSCRLYIKEHFNSSYNKSVKFFVFSISSCFFLTLHFT